MELEERVRRVCRNAFGYDAAELSVLNLVRKVAAEARTEGNQEMLRSIRASLDGYPHCGGDIVVMQHVDRLKKEAVEKVANDFAAAFYIRGDPNYSGVQIYAWLKNKTEEEF